MKPVIRRPRAGFIVLSFVALVAAGPAARSADLLQSAATAWSGTERTFDFELALPGKPTSQQMEIFSGSLPGKPEIIPLSPGSSAWRIRANDLSLCNAGAELESVS